MRHKSRILRWAILLPAASTLMIGLHAEPALARRRHPPRQPPPATESPPASTPAAPPGDSNGPAVPASASASTPTVATRPPEDAARQSTAETTADSASPSTSRSRRTASALIGESGGPVALASAGMTETRGPERGLAAHVGVASPLVTVHATRDARRFTSVNDDFTLVAPIGLGLRLTEALTFDLEFQVATGVRPEGITSAIVDPGLIYQWSRVGAGLRVAWQLNQNQNVGLIPLVSVALVKTERATWFVEAAFPSFVQNRQLISSASLHTGVGF